MERMRDRAEERPSGTGTERRRVESVVHTLANLQGQGETVAAVAHDARNMVSALGLYCSLLEQPGVLAPGFAHYGSELRLVASASRRLVEKLVALDGQEAGAESAFARSSDLSRPPSAAGFPAPAGRSANWDALSSAPVADLAAELRTARNLLAALAGPAIELSMAIEGGDSPVRISGEDLIRVLVNLVKNAAEAMPSGGSIRIALAERMARAANGSGEPSLTLAIEDNGPGIAPEAFEQIFESGYTAQPADRAAATPQGSSHRGSSYRGSGPRASGHRGLGLAITRAILEAAGGRIHAENRPGGGARFVIDLPVDTNNHCWCVRTGSERPGVAEP